MIRIKGNESLEYQLNTDVYPLGLRTRSRWSGDTWMIDDNRVEFFTYKNRVYLALM